MTKHNRTAPPVRQGGLRWRSMGITCLLILPIIAAIWLVDIKDLCAHNPHDPIDTLVLSPNRAADGTMFIIIADQLFRSTDSGQSWQKLVQGLDHRRMLSALVIAQDKVPDQALSPGAEDASTALFLSSDGDGIYRSRNGGDSWHKMNSGLDMLDIGVLAAPPVNVPDPLDPSVVGVVLAAGLTSGLYRTEDSGENWQRVLQTESTITAMTFAPSALDTPSGQDTQDATIPSPTPLVGASDLVLAGDNQGVLRHSTDGGQTWATVWDAPSNSGITVIAFSPTFASDGTLFVGTHDEGIFKSTDGGHSFHAANRGLPFTWRDRYLTLRASPGGPMLRKGEQDVESIALSPTFDQDQTLYASFWNEAVYKSVDGGKTWKRHLIGLTCNSQADTEEHKAPHFRDIRIAKLPQPPAAPQTSQSQPNSSHSTEEYTLLVGGFDGLFTSTDGGMHWQEIETLPSYTTGLAVCPNRQERTVSGAVLPSDISVAISTAGDGTYVSDDGGASWTIRNVGLSSPDVSNIAFGDDRLYATSVIGYLYRMSRIHQMPQAGDTSQAPDILRQFDRWNSALMVPVHNTPLLRTALNVLRVPKWFSAHVFGMSAERMASSYTLAVEPTPPRPQGASPDDQVNAEQQIVFVGTRHHGLLRSTDRGRTFEAMWHPTGPDGKPTSIMDLAVSPGFSSVLGGIDADQTVFASVRGVGVGKSVDGGQTWRIVNEGLSFLDTWASTSILQGLWEKDVKLALSPAYTSDQTAFAASSMGLWKTTDGAESWQQAAPADVGTDYVLAVGLSSNYTNDQTLLVSIKGKGLLKSEDGGQTFAPVKTDPIARNEMIILIRYAPRSNAIYAASEQKLFVSLNGGDTWQEIARPSRHEDGKTVIQLKGSWSREKGAQYSAGSVYYTEATQDALPGPDETSSAASGPDAVASASLRFYGTGVGWICTKGNNHGIARVYLDGDHAGDVDLYAEAEETGVQCFSVSGLPLGSHVIEVQATGTQNPKSVGSRIVLDALDVTP